MKRSHAPMLPLMLTLLVSCAGPGGQSRPLGDPDLITREEPDENSARTAYELVRSLRPQWLRNRGFTNVRQAVAHEDIVICLDNARLGAPDTMQGVALASVQYLRFFTAPEATQRWGGGHLHGAILISIQTR